MWGGRCPQPQFLPVDSQASMPAGRSAASSTATPVSLPNPGPRGPAHWRLVAAARSAGADILGGILNNPDVSGGNSRRPATWLARTRSLPDQRRTHRMSASERLAKLKDDLGALTPG